MGMILFTAAVRALLSLGPLMAPALVAADRVAGGRGRRSRVRHIKHEAQGRAGPQWPRSRRPSNRCWDGHAIWQHSVCLPAAVASAACCRHLPPPLLPPVLRSLLQHSPPHPSRTPCTLCTPTAPHMPNSPRTLTLNNNLLNRRRLQVFRTRNACIMSGYNEHTAPKTLLTPTRDQQQWR